MHIRKDDIVQVLSGDDKGKRGRLSKEMPVDVSNVALIDPTTNKPTRVGMRFTADGTKERFAKKSGTTLSRVAPANAKFAKK